MYVNEVCDVRVTEQQLFRDASKAPIGRGDGCRETAAGQKRRD
jgi:hypothetical protein